MQYWKRQRKRIKKGLASPDYTEEELYDRYLSLDAGREAVITQRKVIEKIAEQGSAVIVGRSADYILKNQPGLLRVFLYAPIEYKVQNVMRKYGDTEKEARKHIQTSDRSRADYYSVITNRAWGDKQGYDLCINTAMGDEAAVELICTCAKEQSVR